MRLEKQMDFIKKLDLMKTITRRTKIVSSNRYENDAEHTFHIAAMAYILKEYAPEDCKIEKSIIMLLFHDVVEIEAGDTFAYDTQGNKTKELREQQAAHNLFGLLPEDQKEDILNLWLEFEAQETPESQFALAMDRLQPIYLNALNCGGSWRENNVEREAVINRIKGLRKVNLSLYNFALKIIDEYLPAL